jgi:hypothetical protein
LAAAIFLGEESSPSTETLNFLLLRNEAISLIKLAQNFSSHRLYSRPGCHGVESFLDIQEHRSRRHIIVEINPQACYKAWEQTP